MTIYRLWKVLGGSPASASQPASASAAWELPSAVFYIESKDMNGNDVACGYGALISADGRAITTYHAIRNAHSAKITLLDGNVYEVESVLGYDIELNIAIVKVQGAEAALYSARRFVEAREGRPDCRRRVFFA